MWGATAPPAQRRRPELFQSTRPVWGATDPDRPAGDRPRNFNPRAPCGARPARHPERPRLRRFQSTRPVWGATASVKDVARRSWISIHAPRVGRDARTFGPAIESTIHFNPRAPCGARLFVANGFYKNKTISIHAPRVGRDSHPIFLSAATTHFNPRAPCGARRVGAAFLLCFQQFQSTRPVWGATTRTGRPEIAPPFQSTRPVWGATLHQVCYLVNAAGISIHAPRVGRDCPGIDARDKVIISIHAPRVGRDRKISDAGARGRGISIHAPRVGRDGKFDDFTPSNLHKRYKRVLARPKNTRKKGKIKQKRAYIHAFSAFLGCEGSGTFCALVLRTQYR